MTREEPRPRARKAFRHLPLEELWKLNQKEMGVTKELMWLLHRKPADVGQQAHSTNKDPGKRQWCPGPRGSIQSTSGGSWVSMASGVDGVLVRRALGLLS